MQNEIDFTIVKIEDGISEIKKYLEFNFNITTSEFGFNVDKIGDVFNSLKDGLYIFIEAPYVDKLYRDTYYSYFATKRGTHHRDTIRVSFFDGEIVEEDFRNEDRFEYLQRCYGGYLIIRPIRKFVGRNLISPKIYKNRNIYLRTTVIETFVNGVKLFTEGFPHNSQDEESMKCAESTIWSLLEYFGTRYSEHSTTLPSKIRERLNSYITERQLPSKGLTFPEMAMAIKRLGLGGKVYAKKSYTDNTGNDNEYYGLLNCYVESGLPVILIIQNSKGIAHTCLAIGREDINYEALKNIDSQEINYGKDEKKVFLIKDFNLSERKLIVIDDNHPPYQKGNPKNPTEYYTNKRWEKCTINFFIVPLPPKIYLEAFSAKNYLEFILGTGLKTLNLRIENHIRLFLTSSRTFKAFIAKSKSIDAEFKELVLRQNIAKYIWVAEISDENLVKEKKVSGLILIDATETDQRSFKPLILAAYNNTLLYPTEDYCNLKVLSLPLQNFERFDKNLTYFK